MPLLSLPFCYLQIIDNSFHKAKSIVNLGNAFPAPIDRPGHPWEPPSPPHTIANHQGPATRRLRRSWPDWNNTYNIKKRYYIGLFCHAFAPDRFWLWI